ncbi:MAG: tRNA (guanosine(37)-N1)-methyltransferase TrmD [candidate division KSB1 bacterium]|nr:tRNA (guanosine(37)-N1)-methyltransferase TrmD [candidate division KSB1 bacterium]
MDIHIITAFPELVQAPLNESMLKRAQAKGLVTFHIHDLRDYTTDKHRQIDDYPYGGGPGMILKPEPFFRCVEHILSQQPTEKPRIIFLTPQGEIYSQQKAQELAQCQLLIFLCGHYKGVDERVREYLATDEISIGNYVLTGGELPALVIIDSVVRLIPGVMSDYASAATDSFQGPLFDYPHYTRPENFRGMKVPEVLLSGHHARIEQWRQQKALERTQQRRNKNDEPNHS